VYSLNSLVRITNKNKQKNYGRIGEITGYAEDLLGGGFYYAVEFDDDKLIFLFLDSEIEPIGKSGNRKIHTKTYVHIEGLMFRISDTFKTDKYKPTSFAHNNIFILRFPEEYAIEHVVPYMRRVVMPNTKFKNAKYLIVDYTKFEYMEYLGMGQEIVDLLDAFNKNGGKEYVFVIQDHDLEQVIKMLIEEKFPKSFGSFEDAVEYLDQQK
jgi:hypothetical protein